MSKKKKAKGGRYLAPKSREGKGGLIVLLPVLCLVGCILWFLCSAPEQHDEALPSMSATTLHEETTVPSTDADPLADYRYIFELYRRAVSEKWDFIACEENRICYMIMFQEDLSKLGYYLIDLNKDGQRELIISDGEVIYDLYASVHGDVLWVLSGGERNSYRLTADNKILNRGSNCAASFVYNLHSWDGTKAVNECSIFFDATQEEPWVITRNEQQDVVTESEAMALIESYQVIPIPLEPIPQII